MNTLDILDRLIAFDTVSANPNAPLITYLQDLLSKAGVTSQIIPDATGKKANLYATIGPTDVPGVMLSGHTDVVPVEGQDWTKPPFQMTESDGKVFGRGTADMKGFVACAMTAALKAAKVELKTPLHLAFSHDEEIGCIGVRSLIDMLKTAPIRPALCIVGEPTSLAVATGHKGKIFARLHCIGAEGHSALAPFALNAIHLASDIINVIRDLQAEVAQGAAQDDDYDVPYTTLHVARINAGVALNIVPNLATIDFEIRNIAADDPQALLTRITDAAAALVAPYKAKFPQADIRLEITNSYPGLDTPGAAQAVSFVKSLTGANNTIKVAFGTEGGLFSRDLDVPTVVCGPGSMAQGHKPDEFVSLDQLAQCDAMLSRLLTRLVEGI